MNVRNIVNSLIDDIAKGVPISQILLKAQIVAFNIGDANFIHLIKSEQRGYAPDEEFPGYRKQKTLVEANVVDTFQRTQTIEVHCEAIEDERIRDLMSNVYIRESLVQLETMYNNAEDNMLRVPLPVFAYPVIKDLYKGFNGQIYSAYHCFPKECLLNIVETFKGQLLDLLMQFDKQLDWNMELSTEKNKSMAQSIINNEYNYNINATVANTGGGTVKTKDINSEIDL